MKYWYSSRPNELFLDIDSRFRLYRAMKILRSMPIVKEIYHYPTSENHCHVIAVLTDEWPLLERVQLAIWCGSDPLRAIYVLRREYYGIKHCDLLVSGNWYHREPDAVCHCVAAKHRNKNVTENCPAMLQLLGEYHSYDFQLVRAGREAMEPIRIPVGKVDLKLLKNWRTKRAEK